MAALQLFPPCPVLEVFLAGLGLLTAGTTILSFLLNRSLLNCRLNKTAKLIGKKISLDCFS